MRFLFSILLILSFINATAQVKFGKVSKEELAVSHSKIDPDAVAEIISKQSIISIIPDEHDGGYTLFKDIRVRIKVYNKDQTPNEYLNVQIPLHTYSHGEDRISNIRAYTYNLKNGKVVKSKVEKPSIFTEKRNDFSDNVRFAFSNAQNGSILEYKYSIESPRFFDLGTWYFQETIPVKYNNYRVTHPETFVFSKDVRGEDIQQITSEPSYSGKDYRAVLEEITYKNVPSLKEEPFVLNTNNMRSSIRFELKAYNNPGYAFENFSMDWVTILKNLSYKDNYGGELKGNNFLDDDVSQFTHIGNKIEKLTTIFKYVQEKYFWNGYDGLYPQQGPRKTYKKKSGNGSDLNFILINMLKKANIDAYPVVISTVDNGMLNVNPSLFKLNHTLTAAIIDDKLYLMDPKDKIADVNLLPINDLNNQGFMILDDGTYKTINLENQLTSEIKSILVYSLENGVVKGHLNQSKNNYFAMMDLKTKANDVENFEENFLSDFDVDVISFEELESAKNMAILYKIEFEDTKSVEEIGNKMLIKPLLFLKENSNSFNFSNSERKYPLEFGTSFSELRTVRINVPEGYEIERLPEDHKVLLLNKVGGYNISFEEKDSFILIQAIVHIGYSTLFSDYYDSVKNMYQEMIEKENEQIIFKKL